MTLGEKIKMHRKQLGLTQTELGERLGVMKNAVSKWECGRVYDIPMSKIKAMAQLFDVQPSYLMDDCTDQQSEQPAAMDGLSENRRQLMQIVADMSDQQAEKFLRLVKAYLGLD